MVSGAAGIEVVALALLIDAEGIELMSLAGVEATDSLVSGCAG